MPVASRPFVGCALQNGHADTLFSRFNAKVVSDLGVVCQGILPAVSDSGHQCNVRFGLSASVYLLVSNGLTVYLSDLLLRARSHSLPLHAQHADDRCRS